MSVSPRERRGEVLVVYPSRLGGAGKGTVLARSRGSLSLVTLRWTPRARPLVSCGPPSSRADDIVSNASHASFVGDACVVRENRVCPCGLPRLGPVFRGAPSVVSADGAAKSDGTDRTPSIEFGIACALSRRFSFAVSRGCGNHAVSLEYMEFRSQRRSGTRRTPKPVTGRRPSAVTARGMRPARAASAPSAARGRGRERAKAEASAGRARATWSR